MNVTLGSTQAYYRGSANSSIALAEPFSGNISFGRIYYKNEEQDAVESEFYLRAHEVAVQFDLNIAGVSLPYDLYDGFKDNLQFTTRNTSICGSSTDSFCYLTSSCSTYYDFLIEYNFKLQFPGQANYLRVPLSTFQTDYAGGGCKLNIMRNPSDEPLVVLGSMFYYAFYADYTNNYNDVSAPVRSLTLFKNYNSSGSQNAYLGNETVREGKDPFQPHEIAPAMKIGLLVAAAVFVAFLMGVMVWVIRR